MSSLRQGDYDRLSAHGQKDSSNLPAHSCGSAVGWGLDAEGTHEHIHPCSPIL